MPHRTPSHPERCRCRPVGRRPTSWRTPVPAGLRTPGRRRSASTRASRHGPRRAPAPRPQVAATSGTPNPGWASTRRRSAGRSPGSPGSRASAPRPAAPKSPVGHRRDLPAGRACGRPTGPCPLRRGRTGPIGHPAAAERTERATGTAAAPIAPHGPWNPGPNGPPGRGPGWWRCPTVVGRGLGVRAGAARLLEAVGPRRIRAVVGRDLPMDGPTGSAAGPTNPACRRRTS